ncbi:helicase [Escherichia coli]|nr:helicase [Escherichia coli]
MNFRTSFYKLWDLIVSNKSTHDITQTDEDLNSPFAQIMGIEKYTVPVHPNQEVLKLIEYPSRPSGIQTFNEQSILSLYRDKIYTIQMLLAIGDGDIREDAFSFTNLVLKPLIEFVRWVHLLPASENHHHNGIGGLFSHSLDVAVLSLKNAYHSELRPIGYQDEEVQRRKLYLYASFICGLVHDAGKIYDVDVVSLNLDSPLVWTPSKYSLLDWARENGVIEYEIHWRSRIHNQHNVWSSVFLERILNPVCMAYLDIVTKERIYSKMISALNYYNDGGDLLSKCVRKADYYSTGTDLNVLRDPVMGLRSNDASARAISTLKHNFKSININDYKTKPLHLIIINGEVYLNENAFLDFVLADFEKLGFNFPQGETGKTVLTESLVQRGYVEPYSDERIVHYFIPGVFTETDIAKIFSKGIGNLEFYNLLKLKWVGLIFDSYKIPDSVPGLFSINANKDFIYIDEQRFVTEYRRPIPGRTDVTKISDTVDSVASSIREVNASPTSVEENSNVNAPIQDDIEEAIIVNAHDDVSKSVVPGQTDDSNMLLLSETALSSCAGNNSDTLGSGDLDDTHSPEESIVTEPEQVIREELHTLLGEGRVPDEAICFVDAVPYLVIDEIQKIFPRIEDSIFCEEPYFQQTHREGSLNGHWFVRDIHDIRLVQLGDCCAGKQMHNRGARHETTLKSLLDTSMYQMLNIEMSVSPHDSEDYASKGTLELPPERLHDAAPVPVEECPSALSVNGEFDDAECSDYDDYYSHLMEQCDEQVPDITIGYDPCLLSGDESSAPKEPLPEIAGDGNGLLPDAKPQEPVVSTLLTDPVQEPVIVADVPCSSTPPHKPHLSPALARLFAPISDHRDIPDTIDSPIPAEQEQPSTGKASSDQSIMDLPEEISAGPEVKPQKKEYFKQITSGAPTHEEYEEIAKSFYVLLMNMQASFKNKRRNRFMHKAGDLLYVTQAGVERFKSDDDKKDEHIFLKLPVFKVNSGVITNTKCYQFDLNNLLSAADRMNLEFSHLIDELLEK